MVITEEQRTILTNFRKSNPGDPVDLYNAILINMDQYRAKEFAKELNVPYKGKRFFAKSTIQMMEELNLI